MVAANEEDCKKELETAASIGLIPMLFPNRQRQPCLLHRRLEQQQIFPSLGLGCRRSKQIGGMVGRNRRHLPSIGKLRQMNAPPHLRDRKHFISRLQKRRNGKSPCEEKHIGLEQFKLPGKPVSAANLSTFKITQSRRRTSPSESSMAVRSLPDLPTKGMP